MIPATYPSTLITGGGRAINVQMIYSITGLVRWVDYIPVKFVVAATDNYSEAGGLNAINQASGTNWTDFIKCYEDTAATKPWKCEADGYIPLYQYDGFYSFFAPLKTSLALSKGTGSPTFTRADATECATVTDFEGVTRTVPANCARFQGARMVRNLIPTSSASIAVAGNKTVTVTPGTYVFSMGTEATASCVITFTGTATGSTGTLTASASARTSKTLTITVGGTIIATASVAAAADVQLENVTGQSVQTAGEYVSVGVLSAPYHGAGVDGIKFFDTKLDGTAINSGNAKFAVLPGAVTSYFSTPSTAATRLTSTLGIAVKVAPTNWSGAYQVLFGKQSNTIAGYALYSDNGTGKLAFSWNDGAGNHLSVSTAAVSFANGTDGWVGVTFTAATGTATFYTSTDGVTWTQLGTPVSIGATTLAADATPVTIGQTGGFPSALTGSIYRAKLFNTATLTGTPILDFNPNDAVSGGSFTSSATGETWTINGGASVYGTPANPAQWNATGPLGYLAEGSRTNLQLQSNSFTTGWTNVGAATITQNQTGPDGVANSAWTITDSSAVAFTYPWYLNVATLTAANYTFSAFVKKTSGATVFPTLEVSGAATNVAICTVDTNNGIATVWTAYTGLTIVTSSARCYSYNANWWRVELTFLASASLWSTYCIPAATTNATQSTGIYDVTAQGSAGFYGAQLELGSFASTYIPTGASAVTRAADALSYVSAGNLSTTVGSVYVEVALPNLTGAQRDLICSAGGSPLYISATNKVSLYDNTAERYGTSFVASAAVQKLGSFWSGSAGATAVGGTITAVTFDGDLAPMAAIQIGYDAIGSNVPYGTIRNVYIWPTALTSAQLASITGA